MDTRSDVIFAPPTTSRASLRVTGLCAEDCAITGRASPAPPVPARVHRSPIAAPPCRTSPLAGLQDVVGGGSGGDAVAPPVPARAPLSPRGSRVAAVACSVSSSARSSPRGSVPSSPGGRSTTAAEPRKHSVLIEPGGRGVATTRTPSPAQAGTKDLRLTPTKSPQVVTLTHWPIRQSLPPPVSLPLEPGTPGGAQGGARRANEYVDSPSLLPPPAVLPPNGGTALPDEFRPHGPGINLRDCHEEGATRGRQCAPRGGPAPAAAALKVRGGEKASSVCQEGIVCARCGRCRCSTCAQPRELPRRWLGAHECSAACAVDTLSCMCCVRAALFHARRSEDEDWSDDPCSCEAAGCAGRWALMAGLALTCLPCLVCYWPLRCALGACTSCYNSAHVIGCKCEHGGAGAAQGTKGLLTPESESSSY